MLFNFRKEVIFIFGRKKETRNTTSKNENVLLTSFLSDEDSITENQAVQLPGFAACVNFISNIIATLPIKLYKSVYDEKTKKYNAVELTNDSRVKLLNDDTNDVLSPYQMKQSIVKDFLIYGNGYIFINKDGNSVKSLNYINSTNVSYDLGANDPIFKTVSFIVNGKKYHDFEFIKLLRNSKNGANGQGIIEENSLQLLLMYLSIIFEKKLNKKGGNKKGFLQSEKKIDNGILDEIREAWKKMFDTGEENMIVLNSGIKFQEASLTSVEMQLNQNKVTNNQLIHSIFGLSPQITSGKATDEEFANAFKTTVLPIITNLQCELNRVLLLESEKESLYFVIDTSELLKADILKRYQAYQIALNSNFLQLDEVRYMEDLPDLGFNYIKLGLQDVLLDPVTKEIYTPNTNSYVELKGGGQNGNQINE